jgi:hypothetical protein
MAAAILVGAPAPSSPVDHALIALNVLPPGQGATRANTEFGAGWVTAEDRGHGR